jgi:ferredoxin
MKAFVDKDACIGCGMCTGICPEVFDFGADGKAEAIVDSVADLHIESARDAESQCPVSAIKVE